MLINSLKLNIVGQTDTQKGILIALNSNTILANGSCYNDQCNIRTMLFGLRVYGLGWRNSASNTPLLSNPAQPQPLNRF